MAGSEKMLRVSLEAMRSCKEMATTMGKSKLRLRFVVVACLAGHCPEQVSPSWWHHWFSQTVVGEGRKLSVNWLWAWSASRLPDFKLLGQLAPKERRKSRLMTGHLLSIS